MTRSSIETIANSLAEASRTGIPINSVREKIGAEDVDAAYAVQAVNTAAALAQGRRITGRKIGLTSKAVQAQLGVDQPDFGILFADMEVLSGEQARFGDVLQPRIEAEVAFEIGDKLDDPNLPFSALARSVDCAMASLEIVGSRIANWDIGIVDTIADNASSGQYVLSTERHSLDGLDLETCGMALRRNGEIVSTGAGAACLGHPLYAALWLARRLAATNYPLEPGDVILSGALGPMCAVTPGDVFETYIAGLGAASVRFSKEEHDA